MQTNKSYIPAAILIVLGLILLGKEFNLFDISWGDLARYWPVLIIIIGLNMIFGQRSNSGANSLLILLCCIAVPIAMVKSCDRNWDNGRWEWNDRHNDDDESYDDGGNRKDDNNDDDDSEGNYSKSQNFSEDMESGITEGKLKVEGGVAGIEVNGTTDKLFEADTKSNFAEFGLNKSITNGKADLNFTVNKNKGKKGFHFDFDENDKDHKNNNSAVIKLNPNIPWSMEYHLGVIGADLDLSPYQVKELDMKIGVSGVELKLGDKADRTSVEIDAGVAGVEIKVPQTVGVKVKTDGFLTGNDLKGFEKRDGYYYSPDYEKAAKKIDINYKGAFGGFEVKRY